MGLKQQSKVFILNQATVEMDIKVVIKEESIVEFRRNSNDSLLFAMSKDEVLFLAVELYPDLGLYKKENNV